MDTPGYFKTPLTFLSFPLASTTSTVAGGLRIALLDVRVISGILQAMIPDLKHFVLGESKLDFGHGTVCTVEIFSLRR